MLQVGVCASGGYCASVVYNIRENEGRENEGDILIHESRIGYSASFILATLAATRSQARFEPERLGRGGCPNLRAERAVATDGLLDFRNLRFGHGRIHELGPVAATEEIVGRESRCRGDARPQSAKARPWPVLGRGAKITAQGVPLDVADDCHKVVVILDRKRLESTLPYVAAVAVVLNVASDVSVKQPLHPAQRSPSA